MYPFRFQPFLTVLGLTSTSILPVVAIADVEVLHGRAHGHTYTVHLESRPFRRDGHRITKNSEGMYLLDGKEYIGEGGAGSLLPFTELSAFDVRVDGKRWHIPSRLWRDCYDPNLDKAHPPDSFRYVHVRLSRGGKRMDVEMSGSDASGGYDVTWHLRPDGRDRREFSYL